ncbi:hypothetical protein LPJ59_000026 [Coemansia sp. RSA 2399]|nr:hypothetical protein LPJ59_000026 [Coemansia sp. RSA 2399]KAJ1908525.1 hypothetical protein LPJ81_000026 [Coemansia sp. IMI 209127]
MTAKSATTTTTTNRKALALKRKLQKQNPTTAVANKARTKKPTATSSLESHAKRQQREKALERALNSKTVHGISQSSTKHSAGRKDVCLSLDRTLARNTQIGEAVRGIGGNASDILTPMQLAEKAREERERMAMAYEHHQMSVTEAVDELAQLMSG